MRSVAVVIVDSGHAMANAQHASAPSRLYLPIVRQNIPFKPLARQTPDCTSGSLSASLTTLALTQSPSCSDLHSLSTSITHTNSAMCIGTRTAYHRLRDTHAFRILEWLLHICVHDTNVHARFTRTRNFCICVLMLLKQPSIGIVQCTLVLLVSPECQRKGARL